MHPSSSEPQIYDLAEKARTKLVRQVDAKDQNLRLLIAHARLFDDLDHHIEKMRARRKRILAEKSKNTETAVVMCRNAASRQPQDPHESSRLANGDEDTTRPEPDLAASCAILEDNCIDSLAGNINSTTAGSNPTDRPKGGNTSNKVHGSPVIIEAHAVFQMISTPNHNSGHPRTIITESPLDDPSSLDYDSDSDSDTDSNSDFDPELDMAANQGEHWEIPVTLSQPKETMKKVVHQGSVIRSMIYHTTNHFSPRNDLQPEFLR
ncbi:MAG: hypothetical protein Q9225_005346 [Loekoesia sp. 1 TL-2023]